MPITNLLDSMKRQCNGNVTCGGRGNRSTHRTALGDRSVKLHGVDDNRSCLVSPFCGELPHTDSVSRAKDSQWSLNICSNRRTEDPSRDGACPGVIQAKPRTLPDSWKTYGVSETVSVASRNVCQNRSFLKAPHARRLDGTKSRVLLIDRRPGRVGLSPTEARPGEGPKFIRVDTEARENFC